MKFELKKKLVAKSSKVKSVDFHPTFPWILIGLYNGSISIYDYNTQTSLHYLEITSYPIRCARFLAEKNYIICGADDKKVRVYNYNTMEKVKEFEAHSDFIRSIVVHLKDPLILTSSDDQTISLWDAEKGFALVRTYDEHKDFVMRLAVNPKDYSMFASASMDKKVKIWSFSGANSHLTLEGHTKGATSVAFCPINDKPYVASGSDDNTIKIWDYTNKHCVFTFEGHENNISAICFHPELPILISGSEDHTCRFWNVNTFKLEDSKIFGYETIWEICSQSTYNMVGLGCDEATLVFRMGSDQPLATFSQAQGKIIYAKQNAISSINLKQIQNETKDGEVINIPAKSLGSTELFPLSVNYSPNGRYFSVLSDKEFVISTSGIYRSSCVGNCSEIAWNDGDCFVTKEGTSVKIYKDLKEYKTFKPGFSFENIFGGPYFSIKASDAVYIYDCESSVFIRKIDVEPNSILWNENKKTCALICDDVTYLLNVHPEKIEQYVEDITDGRINSDEEGCNEAFDPNFEISDKVISGFFIEDVFVYINSKNKINYAINEKIFSITALNSNYSLLGYLPTTNKIYLMNKQFQLIAYTFPVSFVNYQLAILKGDFVQAEKIFPSIPSEYLERVTNFLEKFEYYDISYLICQNPNQKFSLALKLKKLNDAWDMAREQNSPEKLKMVADLALELGEFQYAEGAMRMANDFNGLLLYYSCVQDREKIEELAEISSRAGVYNVAFACYYQLNDLEKCLNVLIASHKLPEAAVFCRTYLPAKLNEVLEQWNEKINNEECNSRMSVKIISPLDNLDENKLTGLTSIVNEYYLLAKNSSIDDTYKLNKFAEVDLEAEMNEEKINSTTQHSF